MKSPVYNVKAVPIEQIQANSYNPNRVAPPEMKLLYESIKEDGYTMPIVCYKLPDGKYEIVDGYHRYTVMLTHKDIYEREGGKLPVVVIDKDISNRMASTIRHNRARGSHSIELMMNIVGELKKSGMSDQWMLMSCYAISSCQVLQNFSLIEIIQNVKRYEEIYYSKELHSA